MAAEEFFHSGWQARATATAAVASRNPSRTVRASRRSPGWPFPLPFLLTPNEPGSLQAHAANRDDQSALVRLCRALRQTSGTPYHAYGYVKRRLLSVTGPLSVQMYHPQLGMR